jgi:hypothetical protein
MFRGGAPLGILPLLKIPFRYILSYAFKLNEEGYSPRYYRERHLGAYAGLLEAVSPDKPLEAPGF